VQYTNVSAVGTMASLVVGPGFSRPSSALLWCVDAGAGPKPVYVPPVCEFNATACPSGTYKEGVGNMKCRPYSTVTSCPPGYGYVSGSASVNPKCQKCPFGTYNVKYDRSPCVAYPQCANLTNIQGDSPLARLAAYGSTIAAKHPTRPQQRSQTKGHVCSPHHSTAAEDAQDSRSSISSNSSSNSSSSSSGGGAVELSGLLNTASSLVKQPSLVKQWRHFPHTSSTSLEHTPGQGGERSMTLAAASAAPAPAPAATATATATAAAASCDEAAACVPPSLEQARVRRLATPSVLVTVPHSATPVVIHGELCVCLRVCCGLLTRAHHTQPAARQHTHSRHTH
jgi:hypothetical protein